MECSFLVVRIATFASAMVFVTGCGGSGVVLTPQRPVVRSPPPSRPGTERVLHSFGGAVDGVTPMSDLTVSNGALYGTTFAGGATGYGTVFEVTPSGTERIIHSFGVRAKDGLLPEAGLTPVNGVLYGTTSEGGFTTDALGSYGTVFEVTPSGSERVIHSFGLGSDGVNAQTDLTAVNGTLYGTTNWGGDYSSDGTAFRQSVSGSERVLHSFGGKGDGRSPSSLVELDGRFFGTLGFTEGCGAGAVFEMTLSGAERLLHAFCAEADGEGPSSGLTVAGGALYGTTLIGGNADNGTVFRIEPSGAERVVYRFRGGTDGSFPLTHLLAVDGVLYGTTYYGGAGTCVDNVFDGCGTVFELTASGTERVLHSFNGSDGANPSAGLIDLDGTLYGTTQNGGTYGRGTVFAVSL